MNFRNLWLAIVLALPSVIVLYVLTNLSYFTVMNETELISSNAVAIVRKSTLKSYSIVCFCCIDLGKSCIRSWRCRSSCSHFIECLGHSECSSIRSCSILFSWCTVWLSTWIVCMHTKTKINTIARRCSSRFCCNSILYSKSNLCINRFSKFYIVVIFWLDIHCDALL